MKHLLIALLVFTTAPLAHAQTAKVIKVKGQQAIVQFPAGVVPQVGQQMDVGGGEGASNNTVTASGGSRESQIGLGVNQLFFLNDSVSKKSRTGIDLNGRYGWNTGRMEFGPLATIAYNSEDNFTVRTMKIGGFFDYNFTPNVSGVKTIYFATFDASFGQRSRKTGPLETTETLLDLFLGGGIKWFGLSDSFCLRADAGFNLQRATPESGNGTSEAGAMVRAGIATYF